ncbi:MAG: phosphonate ABC transporter, permease protein PhnE [Rhodospirillales bacterium]|nr:phosphonate ABC transporter, permease protein PhnE [Rhodospirillales bacterium]
MTQTRDISHREGGTDGLTLVVAPASDHAEGLDLRGLVRHLAERSGIAIELVYCKSYEEAIEALTEGTAEIGWLGPFAYLEAARDGQVEALAVGVPKGKTSPNYRSVFVTQAASPIHALKDVKAKRIAVSGRHSTSGFMVPQRELADAGINLDNEGEFAGVISVANHDEALRAVLDGQVDVAALSSVNMEEAQRQGIVTPGALRVIHRSQDIPGAPLVCSRSLDDSMREKLKDLILHAHEFIDVGGYGGAMERYLDPAVARRKLLESYLRPQWGWRSGLCVLLAAAVIGLIMVDLEFNPLALFRDASAYFADVGARMWPPDFSDLGTLLLSMLETIEIAVLGTLLAILLSIPTGLFSARNIAPNVGLYMVARTITIFFRAVPEFIMAMILVIAVGFGAMPGVIALGLHTMGFLAKFYAEDMEHVSVGPIEALGSMGASRLQVLAFAVVPQIMPSFVGNNLYILDRNVRMATMLGIVGAGGIGYELQSSFRMFEYPRVSAIIFIIFATIFVIDMVSSAIRKKVL